MRLRVEDLTAVIDQVTIVSGVDLEAEPGQIVGLVGPNGSGKSTLLRCVYRVLRPQAGVVMVGGDDVWRMGARQAAQRTAVVVQEPPSEFDFAVWEVVLMGRGPYKGLLDRDTDADHRIVDGALARVGMAAFAERGYATLSGGEKQRVLLARALAQQSRLLVLDEPTNHLDVHFQLEILELVASLSVTTLTALHDLNLAAAYCGHVFVLAAGRVVASGPPEEVFTPELIRTVFRVHAERLRHPTTGRLHLAFSPTANHHPAPGPHVAADR
ncbi:MAG: ABC transporter ATP-binding protein [Egibacteraceae bacterium]